MRLIAFAALIVLTLAFFESKSYAIQVGLAGTPTVTPTPTPPPSYPVALPTPYPTLTAPANADSTPTLPVFSGRTIRVGAGESIQTAVDASRPGDRIDLDADQFSEYVFVTTGTLLLESAPGRRVQWTASPNPNGGMAPYGFPALEVTHATVAVQNLILTGGCLPEGSGSSPTGQAGGRGGPAIKANTASIILQNVNLTGGKGTRGINGDVYSPGVGFVAGGNGGPALNAVASTIYADLRCSFTGGGAGASTGTDPQWCTELGGFWILPAPNGKASLPLILYNGSTLGWISEQLVPVKLSTFLLE